MSGPLLPPSLTSLKKNSIFYKKLLHLWKFAVISELRTNFAEMPGKFESRPGAARAIQGRRGGESESLEEEAIGIGNSYRTSQHLADEL